MDKRLYIPKQLTGTPSKILMSIALVVCILLPYILVKHHSQEQKTEAVLPPIALPNIIYTDLAEQDQAAEIATAIQESENSIEEQKPVTKTAPVVKNKAPVLKDNEWQFVHPRSGDSMAAIFHRLGLTAKNLQAVIHKNPHARALIAIKPSQKLEFLINKHQLEQLIIPINDIQVLTVYREGNNYKTKMVSKKTTSQNIYVTGTVKGSLYSTAQRLNIPSKLMVQMTTILNKQMDFSRTIRPGDQFSIVYNAYYIKDKRVGTGDIQAVRYTSRGKSFEAISHTTAKGEQDYYTPDGHSFKKAFSRYPIKFSHISSTFSVSRNHPILHYKRAHKGIDLAAPIGTPIFATADGIIEVIDRHNGYGNMIKIKHEKPYSTIYGHLLRFQRGLSRGSRVKRGQVIGYVGQTGLATGPHCHYELHVNNIPRNPTTIRLPNASPIPSREIASFKSKANTLLSRLKVYEKTSIASRGKINTHVG